MVSLPRHIFITLPEWVNFIVVLKNKCSQQSRHYQCYCNFRHLTRLTHFNLMSNSLKIVPKKASKLTPSLSLWKLSLLEFEEICSNHVGVGWGSISKVAYVLHGEPISCFITNCSQHYAADVRGWGLGAFLRWWPPSTMWAGSSIYLWPTLGCLNNLMVFEFGIMCCILSTFHVSLQIVANISESSLLLNSFLGFALENTITKFIIFFSVTIFSPYYLQVCLLLQSVALFQSKELVEYSESL